MDLRDSLEGKKVLVTGATGFIGGRLIEQLVMQHHALPIAMVRDYSRASNIARFDLPMLAASLEDQADIDEAVRECAVVYHLAYDPASQKANLKGISNLAQSCIKHEVPLVHISTISIYEPLPAGDLDENSESVPTGIKYADRKLEIEQHVLELAAKGDLKATVLQPTIVYGPYSGPWTMRPVTQLLGGIVVLPERGEGLCNAVYVDDVCQAILIAGSSGKGVGERFLISADKPVTWGEFYGAYQNILGVETLMLKSTSEIRKVMRNPLSLIKMIISDPKKAIDWEPMKSFALSMRYKLSSGTKTRLKLLYGKYRKKVPQPVYYPNGQLLELYSSKSAVKINKAQGRLGYAPQFNLRSGMDMTAQFIRWAFPQIKS